MKAPLTRVLPCTIATCPGKFWMMMGLPATPELFMIWLYVVVLCVGYVPPSRQTTSPATLLLKAFCKVCQGEPLLPLFASEPLGETNFVQFDEVALRPVPLSEALSGLSGALSVIVRVPVRVPVAAGVNVTLIAQDAPAATDVPQLFVCAKSLAFVPITAILVMLSGALPVLLNITACAPLVVPTVWLAKVRLVGDRLTAGAEMDPPVPVRPTVCGLPLALSLTVRVPVRVPVALGVNVTLIVQDAPAATDVPQLFVCAKSPALVPVTARLVMLNAAFPVLLNVTGCAALVVPTIWLA